MENKIITVKNAEGEADTQAIIIHENNIEYAPKISVIIPVYNTEKYLHQCLDSVVNQTLKEIEIICIDDGSTDSSLEILKEYAQKDNRFQILTQKNLHAGVARNAGLAIAKGEYVHFLDSDDWLEECALLNLYNKIVQKQADICLFKYNKFCNFKNDAVEPALQLNDFSKSDVFSPRKISKIILQITYSNIWTKLYSKQYLKKEDIKFQALKSCNDVYFNILSLLQASKITCLDEYLINYRFFSQNNTTSKRGLYSENIVIAYKSIIKHLKKQRILTKYKDTLYKTVISNCKYELNFTNDKLKFLQLVKSVLPKKLYEEEFQHTESLLKYIAIQKYLHEISVIIPVYNVEKYLSKCLDSIINQTFNDIEIICVDDCSTDNSLQILNDYANKDSRIKVIHLDKNRRQGGARNAGLDVATGKYITFIDSDDYVDSNYCEILYNNMIKNDVDLVIANLTNYTLSDNDKLIVLKRNFAKYDRKGEWPRGILNFSLNDDLSIISRPVAKLYRADIINQAQIRFPENTIQEDEAFYWYYMSFVNKLFVLQQSIYNRLLHEESTMFKKIYKNQNLEDFLKILKGIYKFLKKNKLFNKYKKRYKDYFNVVTRSILNNEYLSKKDKKRINSYIRKLEIECRIKSPFSYIFSATNLPSKEGRWYKVVNILGLKFSFRNKKKEKKVKDEQDKPQKEKYYKFKNCPVEQRPEMLKEWYFNRTGETLDIDNPETYNEKIQWLKLYDSTPLKTRLADKYLVRDWVKEKIGEEYLIPLLGVWDKFDDIDFDKLPNQFVLKCNHGCGYNIVVKDKSKLDLKEAKNKINEWMKEDFAFKNGFELHYSAIPRKIIAEAYIKEVDTEAIDYKFICCDGIPYLCWVTNKHLEIHERSFYKLPEWELQNIELKDGGAILDKVGVPKPENLSTMLEICKTLAKDFPFVRVDLYLVQDKILFGEMTFTSASGAALLYPDKWNYILGDKITLPNKKEENV